MALKELTSKDLIEDSEGAHVILSKRHKIPLIVVKSDGGYNYASIDLTALSSFFYYYLDSDELCKVD
jgi:arginyl-tRNA synthetase